MKFDFIINNKIHINDDDDLSIKIQKYIVKYHRIIGIILLTIFILILYCHNFVLYTRTIQKGGAAVAAAPVAAAVAGTGAAGAAATGAAGTSALASAGATAQLATLSQGMAAAEISKDTKTFGEKTKSMFKKGYSRLDKGTSFVSDYSRRSMSALKSYSPIFYRILYTIAFTLIIAIVVLPSLSFLIIGVVCYFLLQKNMDYIKKL